MSLAVFCCFGFPDTGMVQKKIVYERKFEEVSEYLDMLLYAFVKEEKVERALVNVDAAMVDGPMRGVLQKPLIICI